MQLLCAACLDKASGVHVMLTKDLPPGEQLLSLFRPHSDDCFVIAFPKICD